MTTKLDQLKAMTVVVADTGDIASIKACLNHAVDWDLLAINPLAKVKKSRVNDCVKFN